MKGAAIVTGGSTGIGLAIARTLAAEGFDLTVASRQRDRIEAAAEDLRASGAEVRAVAVNLSESESITELVSGHADAYCRLDVLVNNAGMGAPAAVGELVDKHVDLQLDVNLRAIMLSYREALPYLKAAAAERGSALVVNVASMTAWYPEPPLSVYAATKAGIVNFTKSMNLELSAGGIRSTALCPGVVDTEMTEYLRDEVDRGAMIDADDVAGAVRWLLSTSPRCVVPEIPFVRPGGNP